MSSWDRRSKLSRNAFLIMFDNMDKYDRTDTPANGKSCIYERAWSAHGMVERTRAKELHSVYRAFCGCTLNGRGGRNMWQWTTQVGTNWNACLCERTFLCEIDAPRSSDDKWHFSTRRKADSCQEANRMRSTVCVCVYGVTCFNFMPAARQSILRNKRVNFLIFSVYVYAHSVHFSNSTD